MLHEYPYLRALILAFIAWLIWPNVGCQGQKAVDSTVAIQALTAGESNVTYTALPGALAGSGPLADKAVFIPTVPGKNVTFKAYYPDGTPQFELVTARDVVATAMLAGIAGIDAAKFAEDAAQRAWISEERAAWVSMAMQIAAARAGAGGSAPPSAPNPNREAIEKAVADALIGALGRLKADQPKPSP